METVKFLSKYIKVIILRCFSFLLVGLAQVHESLGGPLSVKRKADISTRNLCKGNQNTEKIINSGKSSRTRRLSEAHFTVIIVILVPAIDLLK